MTSAQTEAALRDRAEAIANCENKRRSLADSWPK